MSERDSPRSPTSRSNRSRGSVSRTTIACQACRRVKLKCETNPGSSTCNRCISHNCECVIEQRPDFQAIMTEKMASMSERLDTVIAYLHQQGPLPPLGAVNPDSPSTPSLLPGGIGSVSSSPALSTSNDWPQAPSPPPSIRPSSLPSGTVLPPLAPLSIEQQSQAILPPHLSAPAMSVSSSAPADYHGWTPGPGSYYSLGGGIPGYSEPPTILAPSSSSHTLRLTDIENDFMSSYSSPTGSWGRASRSPHSPGAGAIPRPFM